MQAFNASRNDGCVVVQLFDGRALCCDRSWVVPTPSSGDPCHIMATGVAKTSMLLEQQRRPDQPNVLHTKIRYY